MGLSSVLSKSTRSPSCFPDFLTNLVSKKVCFPYQDIGFFKFLTPNHKWFHVLVLGKPSQRWASGRPHSSFESKWNAVSKQNFPDWSFYIILMTVNSLSPLALAISLDVIYRITWSTLCFCLHMIIIIFIIPKYTQHVMMIENIRILHNLIITNDHVMRMQRDKSGQMIHVQW